MLAVESSPHPQRLRSCPAALRAPPARDRVDRDGEQQHAAGEHELRARRQPEQAEAVVDPSMTSAPRIAAFIVPRPPNSDVPPITAAAIGYSSAWPPPVFVSTERRREARMMPPITAIIEHDREARDAHVVDVDARAPRRLGVAADRVDVAPELRPVEHVGPAR